MESSYVRFARQTAILGVATLLQLPIGLIMLPLLTKTLGAGGYGVWTQATTTVSIILPFTSLGLGVALVRFLAGEKSGEKIREDFYSVLSVVFVTNLTAASLLVVFAYPLAVNFFGGAVQIVRLSAALVVASALNSLCLEFFRTFQRMKIYSIFTLGRIYAQAGLVAYLVMTGHGVFGIVLGALVIEVSLLLSLFLHIKSQIGFEKPYFVNTREYLRFGLPFVPTAIAAWLVTLSDRYVIGFFLGVTSVGVYSAAYSIGVLPLTLLGILVYVLQAPLSQLHDEGRVHEVNTHLRYSLKYYQTVAIPFVSGATILAEPVLKLFTTNEIANSGRWILPLVALAALIYGLHQIVYQILIIAKKPRLMAPVWMFACGLNIGLDVLLVPRIGIAGAAVTLLITYSTASGFAIYYSLKESRLDIDWHFTIKSLIASAPMSLFVWLVRPRGKLDTILTVAAGLVIYAVSLLSLRGFTKQEIKLFLGLFKRTPS